MKNEMQALKNEVSSKVLLCRNWEINLFRIEQIPVITTGVLKW
jgi:hypothetical protein